MCPMPQGLFESKAQQSKDVWAWNVCTDQGESVWSMHLRLEISQRPGICSWISTVANGTRVCLSLIPEDMVRTIRRIVFPSSMGIATWIRPGTSKRIITTYLETLPVTHATWCNVCDLPFPPVWNLEGTSTLRFARRLGFRLLASRLSSPTRRFTVMSRMLGAQIASERFNTAVNTESTLYISIWYTRKPAAYCFDFIPSEIFLPPSPHHAFSACYRCRFRLQVPCLEGLPISGALGDQHAALLGHACLDVGTSKNTYGTGGYISHSHAKWVRQSVQWNVDLFISAVWPIRIYSFNLLGSKSLKMSGCFMLLNTGFDPVPSKHGLLTTIGYKLSPEATFSASVLFVTMETWWKMMKDESTSNRAVQDKPTYALEGSVACAGRVVQWLRDNMGIISSSKARDRFAEGKHNQERTSKKQSLPSTYVYMYIYIYYTIIISRWFRKLQFLSTNVQSLHGIFLKIGARKWWGCNAAYRVATRQEFVTYCITWEPRRDVVTLVLMCLEALSASDLPGRGGAGKQSGGRLDVLLFDYSTHVWTVPKDPDTYGTYGAMKRYRHVSSCISIPWYHRIL